MTPEQIAAIYEDAARIAANGGPSFVKPQYWWRHITGAIRARAAEVAADSTLIGVTPWQPIATAPKDGTRVDLWGRNLLRYDKAGLRIVNVAWGPVIDWFGHERDDWQHGWGESFEPTHWMPLPPAPETAP